MTLEREATPGTTAALRHPATRRLLLGQAVSVLGDQMFTVAVSASLVARGVSAGQLGLVLTSRMAALVLCALVGGVLADRLSRRMVIVATDVARATAVAVLVAVPGDAAIPLVAAVVFVVGAGEAFFEPAMGGLLPDVAPKRLQPSANAVRTLSLHGGQLVGPAIAGLLVASTGPRPVYVVEVVSFALSTLTVLGLKEVHRAAAKQHFLTDLREGFSAVREQPWIAGIIGMACLQLLFVIAPLQVLLPVVAEARFGGARAYGLLVSASGVGAVAGAFVGGRWHPKLPGLWMNLLALGFALEMLGLAFVHHLAVMVAINALAGLGWGPFMVWWNTALQREVPPHLLARVTSIDFTGSLAMLPVGLALTGPAVSFVGQTTVLVVGAAVMLVTALGVLLVPGVLRLSTARVS